MRWPDDWPPSGERADATAAAERTRRDEHRAAQTARKEALAAEAEELAANATQWKAAGDRFRAILDEWKTISGVDRKTTTRCGSATPRPGKPSTGGADLISPSWTANGRAVRQAKERLCERAEALSDSTDWAATSAEFRKLLTEWKAAGRATRDVDDALWRRFKAAQDVFFTARKSVTASEDAELPANATPKRRCWPRRRSWTPAIKKPPARRCARSATSGTRSARSRANGPPTWTGGCARSRRRSRNAGHVGSVDPQAQARAEQFQARAEQFERKRTRPQRRAARKEADEAQANADSGGSGRTPRRSADPQALAGGSPPCRSGCRRLRGSPRPGRPAERPDRLLRRRDTRRRCSSAASCTMVRDHTTRAQW